LPRTKSASLYASYTKFEKQHGTRTTVEATVWSKRRIQYEDDVATDPFNYDTWFDFARLEEDALRALRDDGEEEEQLDQAVTRVREVYERAVANVPMANEKRMWRRYIFLWLYYAAFEELETKVRRLRLPRVVSNTLTFAMRNQSAHVCGCLSTGLRSCERHLQSGHIGRAT
jgi:crooked neck